MSGEPPQSQEHYFSVSPLGPSTTTTFTVSVAGRTIVLATSSGVFSSRGLDKGTAVLLDHLASHPPDTPPAGSTIVDVGCGSGPLALALAVMYPECHVLAVDVNRRAVELCRENARRNSIANVRCVHLDDVDTNLQASLIVSNPPIRVGKTDLHRIMETWLARLEPSGSAFLVVSRHLGADSLARWMTAQGFDVHRRSSSKGFRVLEVRGLPDRGSQ